MSIFQPQKNVVLTKCEPLIYDGIELSIRCCYCKHFIQVRNMIIHTSMLPQDFSLQPAN